MLTITGSYSPFAQLLVTYILSKKSWYQLSDQRKAAVYIKTRAFSLLQYYLPWIKTILIQNNLPDVKVQSTKSDL